MMLLFSSILHYRLFLNKNLHFGLLNYIYELYLTINYMILISFLLLLS